MSHLESWDTCNISYFLGGGGMDGVSEGEEGVRDRGAGIDLGGVDSGGQEEAAGAGFT